ncbi:MAG: sigma-70 family RNA polymerase sigma factor [Myxococcales bacterium]|nr:sigma-70 family RNA polymerase sigma factor [Myxococcales bacterium]
MRSRRDEPDPAELRAACGGDRQALGRIAATWWPTMRRWALIETGDPVTAEDASQDALVRLVRYAHTYDPSRPFATWLRALVRHAARDRRPRPAPEPVAEPRPSVERRLDLVRGASLAVEAFTMLSPRQRALLELCDREGLTPAEAAAELGIDPATARVHLHRARHALRARLTADHDDLHDLVRER